MWPKKGEGGPQQIIKFGGNAAHSSFHPLQNEGRGLSSEEEEANLQPMACGVTRIAAPNTSILPFACHLPCFRPTFVLPNCTFP